MAENKQLVYKINKILAKFKDSFKGLPEIIPNQYINLNDFYCDLKSKLLYFDQHTGIYLENENYINKGLDYKKNKYGNLYIYLGSETTIIDIINMLMDIKNSGEEYNHWVISINDTHDSTVISRIKYTLHIFLALLNLPSYKDTGFSEVNFESDGQQFTLTGKYLEPKSYSNDVLFHDINIVFLLGDSYRTFSFICGMPNSIAYVKFDNEYINTSENIEHFGNVYFRVKFDQKRYDKYYKGQKNIKYIYNKPIPKEFYAY